MGSRSRSERRRGSEAPVLILGATSGVGRSAARAFARRGYSLFLSGRQADEVDRIARDLRIRFGVAAHCTTFDALDVSSHLAFVEEVLSRVDGRLAGVVVAFGLLGEQEKAAHEIEHAERIIAVNYVGAVSVLTRLAGHFEAMGDGFIVGISSVAGDRGRQSNYVYGSAKGAMSLFLQGLRNRLNSHGVNVLTVKLGFVDTQMTFGMPGLFLVADPEVVGEGIVRAVEKKKDVVYLPSFWRFVLLGW